MRLCEQSVTQFLAFQIIIFFFRMFSVKFVFFNLSVDSVNIN